MTAEELSTRHPRLYHVTLPGTWASMQVHGMLSTSRLLDLYGVTGLDRDAIEGRCRPRAVTLEHPALGRAVINDQRPMSERALARCLDGEMTPVDWLALLNARVFFWAGEDGLTRLLGARGNRTRALEVLVIDTLSLARSHADRVELSPINSGATLRKPARRGPTTFTPLSALSYEAWARRRGRRDRILEVTVMDGVPDIARHLVAVRPVPAGPPAPALWRR
jgi:hypothetical protein